MAFRELLAVVWDGGAFRHARVHDKPGHGRAWLCVLTPPLSSAVLGWGLFFPLLFGFGFGFSSFFDVV